MSAKQPQGISPGVRRVSRGRNQAPKGGRRREGIDHGSGAIGVRGPQRIDRRRYARHDVAGARVREPHVQPRHRERLELAKRERKEIHRGPGATAHMVPHREPPMAQPLGDAPTERVVPRDEDLVALEVGGSLVARGGGASDETVARRYDAKLYEKTPPDRKSVV